MFSYSLPNVKESEMKYRFVGGGSRGPWIGLGPVLAAKPSARALPLTGDAVFAK